MKRDNYGKDWILEKGIPILNSYQGMTVRQLYYRLVSIGMPNTQNHYKRVVATMTEARWNKRASFDKFIDRERGMYGETKYRTTTVDSVFDKAFYQVKSWMGSYHKNRWENQEHYIEVWVEKKALQGVFEQPCDDMDVTLGPCKGYPSLTFLHQARSRIAQARSIGKDCVILYYGDYDPSGQDIPRSVAENLQLMGSSVEVEHKMLHIEQIEELELPGVPPKGTDSRTAAWDGDTAVELDAVDPAELQDRIENDILEYFDQDTYDELMKTEKDERKQFLIKMKDAVTALDLEELLKNKDEDDDSEEN